MRKRPYRRTTLSLKSVPLTLPVILVLAAIPVSKLLRRSGVCLLLLLLILSCGFPLSLRAQNCPQSIIFADDFESDPSSRWTVSRESTNPSTFAPRDWMWVHTLPDDLPGSAFFAPDPAAPELCAAPAPGQFGVLLLESPPITVPAYLEGLRLSFNHWVSLEAGFDGGQLMISVNGGPYILVTPESDEDSFTYNYFLSPVEGNSPRFGQLAWSGEINYWRNTNLDLSHYAQPGDTIRLRWDMSTDYCFGTDAGWYIDDVRVYTCFTDTDADGVADSKDNCPETANPDQADFDHDGVGDVCDAPANNDECTNGGWNRFVYPKRFKNQGECNNFVQSNRTIVVHSLADDGPGSLRQALLLARDGSTINIRATGTITLTSGELVVDKSVTISGSGAANLAVSGNNTSRVFHIMPGTTVTISGLKITNGSIPGGIFSSPGGIYSDQATLVVKSCLISQNAAAGIFSTGSRVDLIDSIVTENSGGGIFNFGLMSITRSKISRNFGGGIDNEGILSVTDSEIRANQRGYAGGILNGGSVSTATLTNTVVSDNVAEVAGGGIQNEHGIVTLINSTVKNNSSNSGEGGGIENFSQRSAGTSTLTLINSTISNNTGPGIFSEAIEGRVILNITNSTVSSNSGYGIWTLGVGDGIALLRLMNSTVSNNSRPGGGPGGLQNISISNGSATAEIGNTIFNANFGGSIGSNGTVTSLGYNLSDDAVGGDGSTGPGGLLNGPGDIRNTNPLLGPLQNNGGPTMTHALLSNSPAIDAGDPNFDPNAFTPPLLYDQRNSRRFPRVLNGRIDIGAFEFRTRR